MRIAATIVRVVFGLMFTVFGLNGVLTAFGKPVFPPPPDLPEAVTAFFTAMANTKYMLPMIGATQFVGGLLVLVGRFVPLGLTLLAPVIVNIVLFHHFVDQDGLAIAYVVLVMELFLAWEYAPAFRGVLAARGARRWNRGRASRNA
ncbi:MAG: DoxX family membrane protein [Planctomycetes bacterium]|nr:DoxX family membrane protein [Planctomycetota bacterium]MCC7172113.1 DoxX family membrane protein [Planctomycetota bacterium]